MPDIDALLSEISDEADLCRNDGADDIAELLDKAAAALRAQQAEIERLEALLPSADLARIIEARVRLAP